MYDQCTCKILIQLKQNCRTQTDTRVDGQTYNTFVLLAGGGGGLITNR